MTDPGRAWGDASSWGVSLGYNHTATVGSVAWWQSGDHVAFVEQVSADGSEVYVRADNYVPTGAGGYTDAGWVSVNGPTGFLHPYPQGEGNAGGGGGLSDGTFIQVSGSPAIFRIAGGAPLYVSTWNVFGGSQPYTVISQAQFNALPSVPRDGTILDASGGGVFRVAGGAPLYVSNWNAIGGPQPGVLIDEWDVDNTANPAAHLRTYPADGTILDASGGGVFKVAGGAPLYVSNWNAIGGPQPGVLIDEWDVDNTANPAAHLRTYPADGTILDASGGGVFVVAGGAPLYVSTWNAIGGPQPGTAIDEWDIDNTTNPVSHLRTYPGDGTTVWDGNPADPSYGTGYVFAGGAPLAVTNWAYVVAGSPVRVDGQVLQNYASSGVWSHVLQYPADGTTVYDGNTSSPTYQTGFVFAGGAPLTVTDWANVPSQVHTAVDGQALRTYAQAGIVWSHVREYPTDGTTVTTNVPGQVYRFAGGAPFRLQSCTNLGTNCPGQLVVDQASIDHAGQAGAWAHVAGAPVDGSVIEGMPSGQYWTFTGGCRSSSAAGPAVTIGDGDVTQYPLCLSVSPSVVPDAAIGVAYREQLSVSGGTGPYSWSLVSGALPSGLSLSSSGLISGTATSEQSVSFTVRVTDSENPQAVGSVSYSMQSAPVVIQTTGLATGLIDKAYSQTLKAAGGKTAYVWSLASGSLPTGVKLSTTGVLSGTPTVSGSFPITVRVKDATTPMANVATASFTLVVAPMSISTSSLKTGVIDSAYSATATVAGGRATYVWSLASGSLPTGLKLSVAGVISGTPTVAGTWSFTLKVHDGSSPAHVATRALSLTIAPMSVTTTSLPQGLIDTAYSTTLKESGGKATVKWSLAGGSLPAGLKLAATGVISGTPTVAGTTSFIVKVTDASSPAHTATATLSLTVAPMSITTSSLPAGAVGKAYSSTLKAVGGRPGYIWTVASGALPAGLHLNTTTGAITGTPTSKGTATFTISCTDHATPVNHATRQLTISVA